MMSWKKGLEGAKLDELGKERHTCRVKVLVIYPPRYVPQGKIHLRLTTERL